jgi:hypothetical protein
MNSFGFSSTNAGDRTGHALTTSVVNTPATGRISAKVIARKIARAICSFTSLAFSSGVGRNGFSTPAVGG